jgi:hypothetical protein
VQVFVTSPFLVRSCQYCGRKKSDAVLLTKLWRSPTE